VLASDVSDASGGSLVDGAGSAEAGVSACEEDQRGGRQEERGRKSSRAATYLPEEQGSEREQKNGRRAQRGTEGAQDPAAAGHSGAVVDGGASSGSPKAMAGLTVEARRTGAGLGV
jgi:hypothetical protein